MDQDERHLLTSSTDIVHCIRVLCVDHRKSGEGRRCLADPDNHCAVVVKFNNLPKGRRLAWPHVLEPCPIDDCRIGLLQILDCANTKWGTTPVSVASST